MVKHIDIIHNTEEWYDARAGLATTSAFDKILTAGGKLSAQADHYAVQIVSELLLGRPIERNFDTYAMEWGRQHEGDAVNLYMFETGFDVIHGGFFVNDEMTLGTSPDVIVLKGGERVGIAEIKCPENPAVHVSFLLERRINPKYKPQLFGQMLVTGFEWVDWFSYYPGLPGNRIRIHAADDPEYMANLKAALEDFEDIVKQKLIKLKELGHIDEIPKKLLAGKRKAAVSNGLDDFLMAG